MFIKLIKSQNPTSVALRCFSSSKYFDNADLERFGADEYGINLYNYVKEK